MNFDPLTNLTFIEGLWLVVSLVGLYFAWGNLQESKHDRAKAEQVQNGLRAARIVVADGYVYRNRIRVSIFLWWATLGVMFGFFDPPDVPRMGGLLGLIVTAAGFAFVGMQESGERRALAAIIRGQEHISVETDAADAVERKAEIVAAQLEVVTQEATQRLRSIGSEGDRALAADQRRSADAAERTADSNEHIAARLAAAETEEGLHPQSSKEGDPR